MEGIRNLSRVKRRLVRKYGRPILIDFNDVCTYDGLTLTKLGVKYGFTRANAHLIFKKLHRKPYSEFQKKKTQRRKEHRVTYRRYKKAVNYLKGKNMDTKIVMEGNRPLLQAGNLRLTVQKLSKVQHCGRPHYCGHHTSRNVHLTMFSYTGGYYIIPLIHLPKDKFYIPRNPSSSSKYHRFRNVLPTNYPNFLSRPSGVK